ncbi:MAG: type I CRISPR-associated protein Cas7 [Syntrophomonas sp.]|uniref:type I CRISPR-associated protein Cas7 n=1 Tax=Syntrophomonas sp. TaxID=2053627 RepID=UPI00260B6666|nr:type I CRISPR-associated protein Cas7 [Syntrophomonas sp.]MDD4627546.1 type I CRISPR-associated protein Cas7 [Syntrophomonas sp.]
MIKNNRVYGIIGVGAYMANFNADLSGYPKTTTNNDIFGSDKALKYPMKRMWLIEGEPVLYIKSMKNSEGSDKMQPRDLNERYTLLFGALDERTPSGEVLGNLFSATDVMNFGATFAEKKQNISITGAVQINQGFNLYEKTNVLAQDILSPFRNPNDKSEDKTATSIGTKIVTDEAHYVYSFSVNPANYADYVGLIDGFEGYTIEAYEKFKRAARVATTAFNTNSKSGCENELALFIELKEDSKLFLANLDRYVEVRKKEKQTLYDLSKLAEIIAPQQEEIQSIELFHNPISVRVNYGSLPCTVNSIF